MKTAHAALAAIGVALLAGCTSATWQPQRFATAAEAFASGEHLTPTVAVPLDGITTNTYKAPFEDVWRAAVVSASQAQLNVELEDKAKGYLLAMRSIQIPPRPIVETCGFSEPYNGVPQQRNYFYAIVVREKGPKTTEVSVLAKAQGRCLTGKCWGASNAQCDAYSSVHWATGMETTAPELNQVLTFIRNNLIAAGLE